VVRVGIPRALSYYQYYPGWKAFFEALGAETVVSPPTNKATFTAGNSRAVAETCLISRPQAMGVRVFTPEMAEQEALDIAMTKLGGAPYWSFKADIIGAGTLSRGKSRWYN